MSLQEFVKSLARPEPPENITEELEALWWDGKSEWNKAHNIAQDISTKGGSWIHAYLHRKEGDIQNAHYWYLQAGKKLPSVTLNVEWIHLAEHFLTELKSSSAENA